MSDSGPSSMSDSGSSDMSDSGSSVETIDILVIGAGPAGLAAAASTASAGLKTLLVDENPAPGGQIYRAITRSPFRDAAVLGADYWDGRGLVEDFEASGAAFLGETQVWSLDATRHVGMSRHGRSRFVRAERIILATGAQERPFPIRGWTLPGVMSVGAAQTLLKSSGMVPDKRVVIAGQGPLIWLFAAQILRAGGRIEAILDTTPRSSYLATLPLLPQFVGSRYALKGARLMREVARQTRIVRFVNALRAEGEDRVSAVSYRVGKTERRIEADLLLLHQGVVPHVNLAMAAGIAHRWNEQQACFAPVLDPFGQSGIEGIAIAGDGAGIGGAEAAAERGRLAAWAAIKAMRPGVEDKVPPVEEILKALARAEKGRAFLDRLFLPPKAFRVPPDDETLVCRCEEVTAGALRQAVKTGATGPNQLKAYLRCGMGPCQGRLCGLTVTETIAAERGASPDDVGYYRLRMPVKPLTLGELAAIEPDPRAISAVVRE